MDPLPYSLYRLKPLQRAAHDIHILFLSRASLQVITAQCLQRKLREKHPSVVITDLIPVLLTPRYRYTNKTITRIDDRPLTLVDAAINRFIDGVWVDYTQGQRFTDQPGRLPVSVSALKPLDVQETVNQCGPLLLEHCRQALVDDWTELSIEARSRFESLSFILKRTLKQLSSPTLVTDATHRRMIYEVLQVPDNNLRTGTTRAYLVDQWGEAGSGQLEVLRGMVLVGRNDTGETFLLFTLSAGIEVFESYAALGASLLKRLTGLAPGRGMQWRLYEPRCNIFDGFAMSFLIEQLNDLKLGVELGRRSPYWNSALFQAVQQIATDDFDSLRVDDKPRLRSLYRALPDWVKHASRDVHLLFSQALQDLAQLFNQSNWRFFDDGVPSLLSFTRQKLMASYPKQSTLDPGDVVITVHTVRGASAAGGFPVKVITTLLQVALDNLAGLPGDSIEVSLSNGNTPPSWMTPSFIKQLVSKVDIGEHYPKLVAASLKDSPAEVLWRSRSFIDQLRIELPVLALEFYCRQQWGFTREGYETVAAVMRVQAAERYLGSQVIVLRPLAFKASSTAAVDVVMNMFVIGPQALDAGPVVLFRPMAKPKLMQFADRQTLLTAVGRPGALQQQVLAWMSADARATYRGNGFVAPHFNTLDGLALLIDVLTSKPSMLDSAEVQGDYGQHLYQSQVQAILEQADKQSVSNRENLWARRMEGLSLGLNSVMPLVTGPLAVVGWLQVAWSVHEQMAQANQSGNEDQGSTMVSFFLNMALVLMHYSNDASAIFRREEGGEEERVEENLPEQGGGAEIDAPVSINPVTQLPNMGAELDVSEPRTPIEYGWLAASSRLTPSQVADLQTFSLTKPTGAIQETSGMTSGLWRSEGQRYADVDAYCFKVSVENDGVRVVAANGRRGPWLKSDGKGRWVLDLRLRLLGGDPDLESEAIVQVRELKAQFDTHYAQFVTAPMPGDAEFRALRAQSNLNTRLQAIKSKNDGVALMQQRAKLLVDILQQRRLAEVVPGYTQLLHRFRESQVRCLRLQIELMALKRVTLYEQLTNVTGVKPLTLSEVVKSTPPESLRPGLDQLVSLHEETVALCREQRVAYEAILDSVRPEDTQVSALDIPDWNDKVPILAWWEAGLRPLVLRCLKAKVESPGVEALNLLEDVNLRCRLKLSSYRQLCLEPGYSLVRRRLFLNEIVDELAWLGTRLARSAEIPNNFIDISALGDYRAYIDRIREELVRDLLDIYEEYYDSQAVLSPVEGVASPLNIQSRYYGRLIATSFSLSNSGDSMDFVDPYTHIVYATFIRVEKNGETDWVLRPVNDAQVATERPLSYISSLMLERQGPSAIQGLPAQEPNKLIAPRSVRGNLELLAEKMLMEVERLSERRLRAERADPVETLLETRLTGTANQLIKSGREAYQRMALGREPTTTAIADLLAEGVIEIKEVADTKLKPGASSSPTFRSFYIQKVTAGSVRPEVLWFAHFHYPAEHRGGAMDFYFAHLKPAGAGAVSFDQQLRAAHGHPERLLNIYRTVIERDAAQTLFFSDELTPAQ